MCYFSSRNVWYFVIQIKKTGDFSLCLIVLPQADQEDRRIDLLILTMKEVSEKKIKFVPGV